MNNHPSGTAPAYGNSSHPAYASTANHWQQQHHQQPPQQQSSSFGHVSSTYYAHSIVRHPSDKTNANTTASSSSAQHAAYDSSANASLYGYNAQGYHLEQQLASQQQQQQQLAAASSARSAAAQNVPPSAATVPVVSAPPPPAPAAAAPIPPRIPMAERDVYMLSLPSQDQRIYYDTESGSSDEDRDPSDLDSVYDTSSLARSTTNRGHKLSRSSAHIRRGRLGAFPHTDTGGFEPTTCTKRRKLLSGLPPCSGPGALAVAPNLHLIPRGCKPRPPPAVLPPVPQSPLDLLLTPGLQYTLGPKNQTFKTLGMSAMGLIEQEGPLIGSLGRVCAGLRGEGFDFRYHGDDTLSKRSDQERVQRQDKERLAKEQKKLEAEEKKRAQEAQEREVKRLEEEKQRKETEEREANERVEVDEKKRVEQQEADKRKAEEDRRQAQDEATRFDVQQADQERDAERKAEQVEMANMQDAATVQTEKEIPATAVNDTVAASEAAPAAAVVETVADAEVPTEQAAAANAPSVAAETETKAAADAMEVDEAGPSLPVVDLGALPLLPDMNGAAPSEADDAAMAAALAAEDDEGTATRRRSGRVANRPQPQNVAEFGEEEDPIAEEPITSASAKTNGATSAIDLEGSIEEPTPEDKSMVEELPEYVQRLVDPELYVRSLFVSLESVEMPITRPGLPGQPAVTSMEMVSPNDQEVLLHDCLTDLHRFLADSLEYRDRLSEIRDGVLGVDRRRKGMWKVVRTVAEDWLREEAEAQQNAG
ncbi:BQ5605_C004g03111 [Microbotryum silenes-dioicae]|uniref:BQ5605_C004g03111 protein n=1 Tax=Microbotryum silenes-dioicae TaxID=796604 RepID=A0A2X0P597_9BASI|nr:BQ5605_C004g03111 [Microbotryum silenes-dioicae]